MIYRIDHARLNGFKSCCLHYYLPFFPDLFDLIRTTDANYISKDEYYLFYKDVCSARHVSSKAIDDMVNQVWPLISVKDRMDRNVFANHLSLFELHSLMTIEYV